MTDKFEAADTNETVELSKQTTINVYEMCWDEFVGSDREVDNIQLSEARIEDDDVVIEVTGDVTKRDPREIPVFQSQERWEDRTDTEPSPTPTWKRWATSAVTPLATVCLMAGTAVFSVRLMDLMDLTINGEAITAPPVTELFVVMLAIVCIAQAFQMSISSDVLGGGT